MYQFPLREDFLSFGSIITLFGTIAGHPDKLFDFSDSFLLVCLMKSNAPSPIVSGQGIVSMKSEEVGLLSTSNSAPLERSEYTNRAASFEPSAPDTCTVTHLYKGKQVENVSP